MWMHTRYSPFYAALMIHALTCYLQRNNRGGALVEQHAAKTARESGKDDGEDDGEEEQDPPRPPQRPPRPTQNPPRAPPPARGIAAPRRAIASRRGRSPSTGKGKGKARAVDPPVNKKMRATKSDAPVNKDDDRMRDIKAEVRLFLS